MTLILTQQEVRSLLPMKECVTLVREALTTLSRGQGTNPLRRGMWMPDRSGIVATMPGYLDDPPRLAIKVIAVFPGNHATEYDSHQGIVLLFDPEYGLPLCIMDASEVTAIRTAAASAVATDALAPSDARVLAILGTGVQAVTHLEAMLAVRKIQHVRCYSPNRPNRESFARAAVDRFGLPVQPVGSAEDAVRGANIVCTVTSAAEPVLFGDWLEPGMHVNAVGASVPSQRELDSDAVEMSSLFVDRRESALNESGDFLIPREEGRIDDTHIRAEIGEVLLGSALGRRRPDEITLFKSLGIAVEDVAPSAYVYEEALAQGVGTDVALGGLRHSGS